MLTPVQVFWGAASREKEPAARLPEPPFTHFMPDPEGTSPKCHLTDKNGIKWTVKFGPEVHPDIVAPRLAWALGFGTDEDYYVPSGKIEGIEVTTDLGKCKGIIKADGTFPEARFKRSDASKHEKNHPKQLGQNKQDEASDANWDERKNPGLPPEQLSGLLLLEVMVHNWDSQPKNNKIAKIQGPSGPQTWYVVSDWGASFGQIKSKGVLADYEKEKSFVIKVEKGLVHFKYDSIIKSMEGVHQKLPLAHVQWFLKQLDKLTDADIRAAFQAGYATDAVYKSYAAGNPPDNSALDPRNTAEIEGYVKTFRSKIEELKAKVPTGSP